MVVKKFMILFSMVILISGCSKNHQNNTDNSKPQPEESANQGDAEVLLTKLEAPWSIQKINDTFYLAERSGAIVKWEKDKMTREKVELDHSLSDNPEAGLLGFVLSPDFQESNEAFAYYTYEQNGNAVNRIVVLQYANQQWKEMDVILDGIPSGNYHHGGRLKLGPDQKLYATTGDASKEEIAQDSNSLGGKILRLNLDGSVPEDNPFPGSPVYTIGHRNPQGLAWDEKDQLYSSEHGPSGYDEINKITPGKNYGWPLITGDEKRDGMESPLFHVGTDTWAPSGSAYHEGSLYIGALRGEAVKTFDLENKEEGDVFTGAGRIRDILIDEEYLYFVSNNTDGRGNPDQEDDKLYRLPLSSL
ncbi:sorbosone dehydrogenase family protein [Bacillus sp. V59.32b]|uniref:PQQ-dependent sugar dehydrogenase n=1 Tax=Bacillus sp. V59.32b TaxID=1758642 RepID=UPI0020B142D7|nr:PQQ-dependent sugar dehydrogenase [Bacillus sp. V59.32b]